MKRTQCLELRGRIFWAYRTVPPSLRQVVGKRTLRRSLNTTDLAEAIRLRPLVLAAFDQQIEDARNRIAGRVDLIAESANQWRQFALQAVGRHGEPMPAPARAHLLDENAAEIGDTFGPAEAARFKAMAGAEQFTPVDHYLAEYHRQHPLAEKTKFEQRTAIKRLTTWDRNVSLQSFNKKTASRYCDEGLTFTTSHATKNKQITLLSSYWRWMVSKDYAETNPWAGQSFKPPKPQGAVKPAKLERPFTDDEIQRLLAGPASTRLADTMRIAALSGMRIEEICSVRIEDCQGGIFNIRASKTDAGVRRVPIHPDLAQIVGRRCQGKRPDEFLVHELGPERADRAVRARSDPLGKEFGRYRKLVKVNDEVEGQRRSLVNFHSFRRFFITCAEQAGQPPWVIESVVGHKRSGMSLGTYSKGPSVEQLRACVEAVRVPDGRLRSGGG